MLATHGLTTPASARWSGKLSAEESRIPDLRTNLYWNPAVATDPGGIVKISFNASDVTGRFRVKIEGMTEDGQPFSAQETFHVSFRPQ